MKVGIFGAWRGQNYVYPITAVEGFELYAICDKDPERIKEFEHYLPDEKLKGTYKIYNDYDEFLDSGIEAVLIINYFHEHAQAAIKALKKGIHVFSECNAAATLKDCVELCEAVEESDAVYYYGENYPFTPPNMYAKELFSAGKLGKFHYGEGEYNHAARVEELRHLTPDPYHWRAWMPRTYYLSHSLGPIMYITEEMPVEVNARAVHSDYLASIDFRKNSDSLGMMFVKTSGGGLIRVTGCAAIPSPSRFRIVGENGSVETGTPGLGGRMYKEYFSWATPADEKNQVEIIDPVPKNVDPKLMELAKHAGHWGGDFFSLYNFSRCIFDGVEPFFDVYRGCAMAAVAILGWRSCLNDGQTYKIPDFKNKAERDAVRDDDLSPFPNENGEGATLPPATMYANK